MRNTEAKVWTRGHCLHTLQHNKETPPAPHTPNQIRQTQLVLNSLQVKQNLPAQYTLQTDTACVAANGHCLCCSKRTLPVLHTLQRIKRTLPVLHTLQRIKRALPVLHTLERIKRTLPVLHTLQRIKRTLPVLHTLERIKRTLPVLHTLQQTPCAGLAAVASLFAADFVTEAAAVPASRAPPNPVSPKRLFRRDCCCCDAPGKPGSSLYLQLTWFADEFW